MNGAAKGFLAIAFAAAVLYLLQHTTPGYGDITSPIPVTGRSGQKVEANAFAINIAKTHLARTVTMKGIGRNQTFTTSGLWVLVEGVAEARSESLTLASAQWLGAGGIRYALTQRFQAVPGLLPSQRLEPGLPRPVLMAFEIPENQLAGGTLLLARSAWMPLEEEVRIRMTDMERDGIKPTLELARNAGAVPWTLSGE